MDMAHRRKRADSFVKRIISKKAIPKKKLTNRHIFLNLEYDISFSFRSGDIGYRNSVSVPSDFAAGNVRLSVTVSVVESDKTAAESFFVTSSATDEIIGKANSVKKTNNENNLTGLIDIFLL